MRPSISRYKKFRFASKQSPKVIIFSVASAAAIAFAACRVHNTQSQAPSSEVQAATSWNLNPIRAIANLAGADDAQQPAIKLTDNNKNIVSELLHSSCGGTGDIQVWRLRFATVFGPQIAKLSIDNRQSSAKVTIDDRELTFKTFAGSDAVLTQAACAAVRSGTDVFTIDDAHATQVKQWLSRIAPDCEFKNQDSGWFCQLPTLDTGLAQSELDGIHRTMLMRWNRQPYLISRRLAVTRSLAQAVREPNTDGKLNTLCRILGFALPSELPVAMATMTWQDHVCKSPDANRLAIARVGLNKALDEIDFLRKLFEQNSKLGTLIVRIPRADVPTRDVWISLKPTIEETPSQIPHHACWHPLFKGQSDLLTIARQMDLLSEADGTSCDEVVATGTTKAADASVTTARHDPNKYLAESITSETEFVITNGHSKLLRLPMGTYTYTVRPHSEALGELETDPNVTPSTGTIVWSKQRPSVLIKQW